MVSIWRSQLSPDRAITPTATYIHTRKISSDSLASAFTWRFEKEAPPHLHTWLHGQRSQLPIFSCARPQPRVDPAGRVTFRTLEDLPTLSLSKSHRPGGPGLQCLVGGGRIFHCGAYGDRLAPHESPETDIILLGHSMGGILAAEIVLLTSAGQYHRTLRHRILGTISFDTPFLGMHPGIVPSGIGSLFRSDPKPALREMSLDDMSLGEPGTEEYRRNFNQRFNNDVNLPQRTGLGSTWHFINKHSKNLKQATKVPNYVASGVREMLGGL
ncbi:hypothetical protein MRB53_039304 [Persea americana]|nr:hypothetical protein MRB53_039304 [Persea americana]